MTRFNTAQEAADWINGARWKGEKKGLENTRALLEALGHPEMRMGRILHVAGTNGKGSTAAFLAGALGEKTSKVGLFTSPYLCRFNERIVFGGEPIRDEELIDVASRVREAAERLCGKEIYPTTFELLTAAACLFFAERSAEYSVMEVGMGGRLDATNVLPSSVSVIARIGLDHTASLGDTVELIAAEKAGIMKPGIPAVVMAQDAGVMKVFRDCAERAHAPLIVSEEPCITERTAGGCTFECALPRSETVRQTIRMAGLHQAANAALALTALDALGFDLEAASRGILRAFWPGRLDLRGNVLIDCAHNPQGAQTLAAYLEEFFPERGKILLTGMMRDKQLEACASIFSRFASRVVTTRVDWPRAVDENELAALYHPQAQPVSGVPQALGEALRLAGEDGLVVCAGSVYLAGAVLNAMGENAFTLKGTEP